MRKQFNVYKAQLLALRNRGQREAKPNYLKDNSKLQIRLDEELINRMNETLAMDKFEGLKVDIYQNEYVLNKIFVPIERLAMDLHHQRNLMFSEIERQLESCMVKNTAA